MKSQLPNFKYHPDPVKTGHVISCSDTCICCGQARGFIYSGPIYAIGNIEVSLCPWCIADGTAYKRLGFEFTDGASIGGSGDWETVSADILEEVTCRTPGFCGWQQERWFTHCNDAAAFLGVIGWKDLVALGEAAILQFADATGLTQQVWRKHLPYLDKDGSPTGYLFQCLHCGIYGGYTDVD